MTSESSYQRLEHDFIVAKPKPTNAIPISLEELSFIKNQLSILTPEINLFLSIGFFLTGSSFTCLIEVLFGNLARKHPDQVSPNEILLWVLAAFLLLSAIGCFIFAKLRYKDSQSLSTNLNDYIASLEKKFHLPLESA